MNDDSLIPRDEILETRLIDGTRLFKPSNPGITRYWTMKLRGYLKPRPYDCAFEFMLNIDGRAKVHTILLFIASGDLLSLLIALRR